MKNINLNTLILYNNIRQDQIVTMAANLNNAFNDNKDIKELDADYFQIQRELLEKADYLEVDGSYWQNYICRLVAESENRFSLMAEKGLKDQNLSVIAAYEMATIKKIYNLNWDEIEKLFANHGSSVSNMRQANSDKNQVSDRNIIKMAIEAQDDNYSAKEIQNYYRKYGCGIFERHQAFVWDEMLVGVKNYDRITFEQLVGYEIQKAAIIENTEVFLKGFRANNVLLHGDRGTGKSSCVKALLNKFKDSKLKLISLNKNHVEHLYKIIESIADRGCKFIIFIDDLSFEENEISYKHFKSIIDGGIEAQPSNVLIYVTSNRRNIIKETWKDRGDSGEVHHNDGMQERLSLADRFGLSITFTSPDREEFLKIVKGIAGNEAFEIDETLLTEEAMRWDVRQKGRSGRSARQFINYIHGKTMR